MAAMAESNEVFFAVVSLLASELLVVYFEHGHGPASLAAPAVALENTKAQLLIGRAVETRSRRR
jgi:hypothetical protein